MNDAKKRWNDKRRAQEDDRARELITCEVPAFWMPQSYARPWARRAGKRRIKFVRTPNDVKPGMRIYYNALSRNSLNYSAIMSAIRNTEDVEMVELVSLQQLDRRRKYGDSVGRFDMERG